MEQNGHIETTDSVRLGELALTTVEAEIHRFKGESFEDHVETWERVDESLRGHFWMLGAIAASVQLRFGRRGVLDFARRVYTSPRRVEEYAETYRKWELRERSQILTFTHHTIATRADDPELAIETAEAERYSTRELALWVAGKDPRPPRAPKSPGEPESPTIEQQRNHYDVCDKCGGRGVVWTG